MIWNDIFYYDETSPSFIRWSISVASGRYYKIVKAPKDSVAGNITADGYYSVKYDSKNYLAHRVIYEMFYGEIPEGMFIDHIDGDRGNNNINNLRLVNVEGNARNIRLPSNNTSGVCGVTFCVAVDSRSEKTYYSPSWRAQWYDLNGKRRMRAFSTKKYGYQKAFDLACTYRQQMIDSLNIEGAGYTERHGKEFNMQKFNIGDKVVCTCKDLYPRFNEILHIAEYNDATKQYTLLTNTGAKTMWSSKTYPNDFKLYKGEPVFKTDEKYYINVQKYALYAGITLKQAHEEIQKWLHDLGIWWSAYYDSTPRNVGAYFLCITDAKHLGWADSMSFCTDEGYIEVEFTRKQSVELTPEIKEDLVEFNGKKYSKDKLAKALKLIDESNLYV